MSGVEDHRHRSMPCLSYQSPLCWVGSAPSIDLACWFTRSWRSYCLSTSLGSYHSPLPYSAITWIQAVWMALLLTGMKSNVLMRICSLALAALAISMHLLLCSLNISFLSIRMPTQGVASSLNYTNPFRNLSLSTASIAALSWHLANVRAVRAAFLLQQTAVRVAWPIQSNGQSFSQASWCSTWCHFQLPPSGGHPDKGVLRPGYTPQYT